MSAGRHPWATFSPLSVACECRAAPLGGNSGRIRGPKGAAFCFDEIISCLSGVKNRGIFVSLCGNVTN